MVKIGVDLEEDLELVQKLETTHWSRHVHGVVVEQENLHQDGQVHKDLPAQDPKLELLAALDVQAVQPHLEAHPKA